MSEEDINIDEFCDPNLNNSPEIVEDEGVNNIKDLDKAECESSVYLRNKEKIKKEINAKELIDSEISPEMKQAYLNYAMSVIVARALPSAEDGLKPVHRRILWSMHQMGLFHNKQTKKSGRIVGDAMGKYHPHGDAAIYDAMVRMAQPFSMRYPLVLGQGNFGSMDGDSAAASRYTEAKMQKISDELLLDIDKEGIVPMMKNYDNTMDEPIVLPGKLPNLLLNGGSGIAVGMATNLPPHNLNNVCDSILTYIENPNCEDSELIKQIKAPDFPTGGVISGELKQVYETGKGKLIVEGKVEIEEEKKTKKLKIIISEIPYQVNKAQLVEQIANLVKDKKLPDISDIRDESSKGKVRVVIELRKNSNPKFTINRLYKYTNLRTSFNVNMLALVDRKPELLSLRRIIQVYVSHRQKVIRKTKEFDLDKAENRLHIVEGLLVAQSNIDEVIKLIRASKSKSEAQEGLIKRYSLTVKQVDAILEMKLSQLTSLEYDKIKDEESNLIKLIEKLKKILNDEKEILNLIKEDLNELKEKYGDKRKTKIVGEISDFEEEDLVDKKDVIVTVTEKGYIKRIDVSEYKEQKRGGKGVIGSGLTEDDFVKELLTCSTHDYLLCFTNKGKVHWIKAYEIPENSKNAKGKAIINLLDLKDEQVTRIISVKNFKDYLIMATKKGIVKRIELSAFSSPRKGGIKAIKVLESNDILIDVRYIKANQEVLLVTSNGQAIRFNSNEVRLMGRASYGVTGIKLNKGDFVVSLDVLPLEQKEDYSILTITKKGYGKRSPIEDYRLTGRACKGVINMKLSEKTGNVISSTCVTENDTIIVTTHKGIVIRMSLKNIRIIGRATQGVKLINLNDSDYVSDLVRVPVEEDEISFEDEQKKLL
ncbi:MAG: DNA gyrase subunit A [Candidatus Nanoarchaeia archaeon]|nr:DNA gyrase subunit A [Candidatus Nanoarchaeia archaeon]MDD4563318.1 DNA gyrase subunit A [Candidatus Nanoarchaeia archaeon]